jgi:hypothetical protein
MKIDGPAFCILYEDRDRAPEIFLGEGAESFARQRFRIAKDHWSCHLMMEIEDSTIPGGVPTKL